MTNSCGINFVLDVIDRLNSLRGKGMAALYSWSSKRLVTKSQPNLFISVNAENDCDFSNYSFLSILSEFFHKSSLTVFARNNFLFCLTKFR